MISKLSKQQQRDQRVWNNCAESYENAVVNCHPDIRAYEDFEEELLDRVLHHLIGQRQCSVSLYDIGCGSGRLHLRYGMKTTVIEELAPSDFELIREYRSIHKDYCFDRILSDNITSVGGIDFSSQMIELANRKLVSAGLRSRIDDWLSLEIGSAYDLTSLPPGPVPVVVNLCNSIGVMQGTEGAVKLFKTMRRMVESAGGIAVISAYRKEAIEDYALNNYESTMNVSGQPRWLVPDTYAGSGYQLRPRKYKTVGDTDPSIIVDVFGQDEELVLEGQKLTRDASEVQKVIDTGHIQTYTDYKSHWYSYDQIDNWIAQFWPKGKTYHIVGKQLDDNRAVPVQLAILDTNNLLQGFFKGN